MNFFISCCYTYFLDSSGGNGTDVRSLVLSFVCSILHRPLPLPKKNERTHLLVDQTCLVIRQSYAVRHSQAFIQIVKQDYGHANIFSSFYRHSDDVARFKPDFCILIQSGNTILLLSIINPQHINTHSNIHLCVSFSFSWKLLSELGSHCRAF